MFGMMRNEDNSFLGNCDICCLDDDLMKVQARRTCIHAKRKLNLLHGI